MGSMYSADFLRSHTNDVYGNAVYYFFLGERGAEYGDRVLVWFFGHFDSK